MKAAIVLIASLALAAARTGDLQRSDPRGGTRLRPPCPFLNSFEEGHYSREGGVGQGFSPSPFSLPARTGWTWRIWRAVTIKW